MVTNCWGHKIIVPRLLQIFRIARERRNRVVKRLMSGQFRGVVLITWIMKVIVIHFWTILFFGLAAILVNRITLESLTGIHRRRNSCRFSICHYKKKLTTSRSDQRGFHYAGLKYTLSELVNLRHGGLKVKQMITIDDKGRSLQILDQVISKIFELKGLAGEQYHRLDLSKRRDSTLILFEFQIRRGKDMFEQRLSTCAIRWRYSQLLAPRRLNTLVRSGHRRYNVRITTSIGSQFTMRTFVKRLKISRFRNICAKQALLQKAFRLPNFMLKITNTASKITRNKNKWFFHGWLNTSSFHRLLINNLKSLNWRLLSHFLLALRKNIFTLDHNL
jgi:hypothetical protein